MLGLVLGAFAPACATGNDSTAADESATVTQADGGEGGACGTCPSGTLCSAGACVPANTDSDGDGFDVSKDCDDKDRNVHPGATETCNGKDDDCNGKTDEGFDVDGDGYAACDTPGKKADCDDKDPTIHPGAVETCNEKDDDCDGVPDNGFDKDNDGFYTCKHGQVEADCDDADPKIKPGGAEVCNGKDDDCDGKIDEVPASMTGLAPPLNPHWVTAGAGSLTAATGWARLTSNIVADPAAGALWWRAGGAGYTFDTFDVTFTIWIENKAGADGMGFVWVPGTNVANVGLPGGGLGLNGLGGYGVMIDTYTNAGEPAAPFLAVMEGTNGAHLARVPIPNVRTGSDHVMRVKLDAGKVSAWIDSVNYMNDFPIPGYVAFTGHWGFTAAVGGLSEEHRVKDITMSFPNGQGCVP
jgi:hypothetical protein